MYDILQNTSRVFVNRIYAWFNKERKRWERIRVLRTDLPKGKTYIRRLDYGENVVVNLKDMMEMNPKFCLVPLQTQRAHLVHIKPTNNQEDWNHDVIEKFKRLADMGISLSFYSANEYA